MFYVCFCAKMSLSFYIGHFGINSSLESRKEAYFFHTDRNIFITFRFYPFFHRISWECREFLCDDNNPQYFNILRVLTLASCHAWLPYNRVGLFTAKAEQFLDKSLTDDEAVCTKVTVDSTHMHYHKVKDLFVLCVVVFKMQSASLKQLVGFLCLSLAY